MALIAMDQVTVIVPDSFPSLVARRFALDRMQALDDGDYRMIADLYATLADDFERIGYTIAGASARKKALYWGWRPTEAEPEPEESELW